MPLEHPKREGRSLSILTLAIAALALVLAVLAFVRQPTSYTQEQASALGRLDRTRDSLERTKTSRTLRVGYSGFRPYTIIDLTEEDPNQQVSGFCVDMVREIASRQDPPWEIEWHKVNFETLKADMASGKFDVFADAVYQEIPRASEFGFTIPYSYFGVGAAIVRKGEDRFQSFEDLDDPDITISLAEGWTATTYARRRLTKPSMHVIAVGDDPFVQFQDVISGRADVALQDVPTVLQFAQRHADQVDALWTTDPPTRVAAGFMTRDRDWAMLDFLNTSLRALQADGTLKRLDQKWNTLSSYPELVLWDGQGLHPQQ